jgi:hypothetical protein
MASDTQGSSCSSSREDSEHTRVQKSISQAKSSSGSREKREKRGSMDSEAIFPIFSHHQNQERSRQLNTAQQTKTTSGLNEERQSAASQQVSLNPTQSWIGLKYESGMEKCF